MDITMTTRGIDSPDGLRRPCVKGSSHTADREPGPGGATKAGSERDAGELDI